MRYIVCHTKNLPIIQLRQRPKASHENLVTQLTRNTSASLISIVLLQCHGRPPNHHFFSALKSTLSHTGLSFWPLQCPSTVRATAFPRPLGPSLPLPPLPSPPRPSHLHCQVSHVAAMRNLYGADSFPPTPQNGYLTQSTNQSPPPFLFPLHNCWGRRSKFSPTLYHSLCNIFATTIDHIDRYSAGRLKPPLLFTCRGFEQGFFCNKKQIP